MYLARNALFSPRIQHIVAVPANLSLVTRYLSRLISPTNPLWISVLGSSLSLKGIPIVQHIYWVLFILVRTNWDQERTPSYTLPLYRDPLDGLAFRQIHLNRMVCKLLPLFHLPMERVCSHLGMTL